MKPTLNTPIGLLKNELALNQKRINGFAPHDIKNKQFLEKANFEIERAIRILKTKL